MAKVYLLAGELVQAERSWRAALAPSPGNPDPLRALGAVGGAQNRTAGAGGIPCEAGAPAPGAAQAPSPPGARPVGPDGPWAAAVAPAREAGETRHQLSRVLLAGGDRDAATRELERILVVAPDDHRARTDLALHDLTSGSPTAAAARLDQVLAAAPDDPRARF